MTASQRYSVTCLIRCACRLVLYAVNRWLIKPSVLPFVHQHFNDLLLIPAALPIAPGFRDGLTASTIVRQAPIWLIVWSVIVEFLIPSLPGRSANARVLAYRRGAAAGVWWNRKSFFGGSPATVVADRAI
jgi:hypothetical protein